MHDVFRGYLSPIKSTAKSQDIIKWKQLPATKSCYKKLFDESDFPGNPTYMKLILEKSMVPNFETTRTTCCLGNINRPNDIKP
jgi:hypothetical protein